MTAITTTTQFTLNSSFFTFSSSTKIVMQTLEKSRFLKPDETEKIMNPIKWAIELGWNVNTCFPDGSYLLHHIENYPKLVKLVLEKGADTSLLDSSNRNVFFYYHNPAMVKLLLDYTKNSSILNRRDVDNLTPPLYLAISAYTEDSKNVLNTITCLIENGAEFNYFINERDETIFHYIAKFDKLVETMKLFIDKSKKTDKPNINSEDKSGLSPLANAIKEQNFKQIRNLVELGASWDKNSLLSCLQLLDNIDTVHNPMTDKEHLARVLLDKVDLSLVGYTKLYFACYTGVLEWIREFSKKTEGDSDAPLEKIRMFDDLAKNSIYNTFLLLEAGAPPPSKEKKAPENISQLYEIYRETEPSLLRYQRILSFIAKSRHSYGGISTISCFAQSSAIFLQLAKMKKRVQELHKEFSNKPTILS